MKFSLSNLKKIWKNHRFLLVVLILVFLLRLPLLFEPFTYADEGIYLTLGQAVRKGLVLYRDIHDNKPPMLYLIAAAAGSFPVYRLIHFLWSFATIFVFYKLAKLLFAKNKRAIIISTSIFALLTSLHTFEGNIANAENFMLLPILGAFFLILKTLEGKPFKKISGKNWFLAGIFFSLATLFKVPAAFDFAAATVFCFLVISKKNLKSLILNLKSLAFGLVLPILLTIIYFASQNALPQYLTAAFSQNLPYLSSWVGGGPKIGIVPGLLIGRAVLVGILIILLFIFRKKLSSPVKLIVVWFSFSLFAALLSSRPYPHYLIQILPSFSLSFGFFAFPKNWLKSIPVFLGALFVLVFLSFHFWYYPNLPYLLNFYQFVFGVKSHQDYLSYFGHHTQSLYQTAAFIRTHTMPKEKIFIWGTQPSIYSLSQRLPVGRYTVSYHIIDFNGYEEVMEALNQKPPRWIIVTQDEKRPFPQLKSFIQDDYTPFRQIGDIQIFHHIVKKL